MKTLKLTDKDFKQNGIYKEYTGKEDLTNFEGNLEFEADLGWMKFLKIKVSGYILIEAGGSIKAGDWIEAGGSIKAGDWIEAGGSIKAGDWIKAGGSIEAGGSIKAGDWIEAGDSIEAGDWIEAGDSIKAGDWIEAVRGGILAGLTVTCKGLLKFKLRLFAGVTPYSWQENADKTVTCGKLEGNVVYGDVKETGLPESESANVSDGEVVEESFTIDGKKYIVTDDLRQALKNIMKG